MQLGMPIGHRPNSVYSYIVSFCFPVFVIEGLFGGVREYIGKLVFCFIPNEKKATETC